MIGGAMHWASAAAQQAFAIVTVISVCERQVEHNGANARYMVDRQAATMTHRIALLRGINVGRAKRIAMADLRSLTEDLGFTEVRTLLNSGNVLFQATRRSNTAIASAFEAAIRRRFGFAVPVVVLSHNELNTVVAENSLPHVGSDPAKLLVAFGNGPATLRKAKVLLEEQWEPEALVLGSRAAYLWCANGIIQSRLAQALSRVTGNATTTRNWATVLKLHKQSAKAMMPLNK